jgi:hypothetical protein
LYDSYASAEGQQARPHEAEAPGASQYFLRDFSLDHGTDFAAFVDGVPYNLPTNAHGQGYLDLNSVIPKLVGTVEFH